MLDAWMTSASMPHALSQRASQKPSRPASKATAIRSILRPAFSASSRHRYSSFSNVLSSTASFFNGWRSTPGTMPATSQLDRLISMTAISVPSGSRAVRDRLRSFNFCMGRSIGSHQRRWMQYPRRRPIASSSMGFEDEAEQSNGRPCRQTNGGSKRPNELTSSIVPRGTSFHRWVELECSPIGFDPARFSCRRDVRPPAYLARLNPSSATPPADPARLVHFISSPEIAIVRFCSVPFQFGNVLNSTLITRTLSTTEYVPKVAMLPRTTAVFSSAVPVPRLLDANFGRSALVNR